MPLYHKSNLDDIFRRYRAFYEGGATGAMVFIRYITELENDPSIPKIRPLNQWNFDTELHDFLDACIAREDAIFARREDVEDDNIPSVQPRFGIGEHSAYLGGEVLMEEDTSYNTPFITDWSQTANLHTDPENIWFRRVIDGIRYIREHGGDRVAPRARGGCSPADLVNFIRGNDMFTDLYEYPDELHELLARCAETERWFADEQMKALGDFYGGAINGFGFWMPPNSFGHLSEDWSYMCSPAMYREFGQAYTDRMTEGLDHVYMHVHSGGAHILPDLVRSKNITTIELSKDPNQPTSMQVYEKYGECLKDKIVVATANYDEIVQYTPFLNGRKTFLWVGCETVEEAKKTVRYVREHFEPAL